MKLKSLLLGSAAVLVGAIGSQGVARAADAIVVEPEPVEYVRICDAYGKGWFYIPGTETCLKFDGDVRVQYGVAHYHTDPADETSAHEFNYRVRLNVRANNETEYGTLASRIRFRGVGSTDAIGSITPHQDLTSQAEGPYSGSADVDWAVISLAGFRIGFADSYWATAGSYGFYQARFDGPYSFRNGLFFDYTWAGNGWTATIGLEDGAQSGEAGAPDIYGGVTYSGSGWYLAGIYYYNSSASAGAWKVRADYDFGTNGFAIGGWYMDDNGDTDYVKGHDFGITAKMNLTDNLVLFGGYGQHADEYNCPLATWNANFCNPLSADASGDTSFETTTVGVAWNVVPGLLIQPEWLKQWSNGNNAAQGFGRFSLRIVRSF